VTEIPYTIRRSDRARRVRVTVDAVDGVEVVLPRRARERDAEAAMRELRPWVEKRLEALDRARQEAAAPAGHVPFLGEHLRLVPEPTRTRAHRRGDVLLVPAEDPGPAIERWYRRVAKTEIAPRVERAVAEAQTDYERLSIRGQRTRWGSCSSTGTLSFNWRLLLAPEPVLDYVVWHEVCHLLVADHSKRFWRLVEHHVPGYREQERWLRRYGSALVLPAA
jgi:predicted metal-dependent hydrolase